MITSAELTQDLEVLTTLMAARHAISMETMSHSQQMLWRFYLTSLDEVVSSLSAVIKSLPHES